MSFVDEAEIKLVEFETGDVLFEEHEESFHFFILQEGEVEVFKTDTDGRKIPLAVVEAGQSIGEFAMIDRQPRSATAAALTHVKAALITEDAYRELLNDLPDWAISVMTSLVERIRHTNEILRHRGQVDPKVLNQLDSMEFTDSDTIVDENPFLADPDDSGDFAPAEEHRPKKAR